VVRIDSHMHVYETAAQGIAQKSGYLITEYGPQASITFSSSSGDEASALAAIDGAGFQYAIVANLFFTRSEGDGLVEVCPGAPDGSAVHHDAEGARQRLVEYNDWVCELSQRHSQLVPLICVDPSVMRPAEIPRYIATMASDSRARGVKLHPIAQRFAADDERLDAAYAVCAELQLPVLMHAGSGPNDFASPARFAGLMRKQPQLKLVMAHLGGAEWRDVADFAEAWPNARFDCSEIIAWAGVGKAPSRRQLAELIKLIGANRVLLGTDFPWYDLDTTADQLESLPILTPEEKILILGENAMGVFNL